MASLLWYAVLAVGATAVVWAGSGLLERASERLSIHYGLPPVVQGAVVVAIGSSFPELASVVLSTLVHGEFGLGVGAIVGSAVFNVLVIPGVSALAADELSSSRDVVYKEAQFYMLAVAVLLITFSLAVIYHPGDARLTGEVTRLLVVPPLALYGLYVFIQFADTRDHTPDRTADVAVGREWLLLGVSLVVIVVAVEGLVQAALGFGRAFDTPPILWGLTVIAAGTSLPDAFVSVRAARDNEGVTSLANVLGSNTFDLLVALPVGVLLAGAATIDFAIAVPMFGVLTAATVLLFTILRTDLAVSDREAYALLTAYAGFVGWMVLESMGVLRLVPGI